MSCPCCPPPLISCCSGTFCSQLAPTSCSSSNSVPANVPCTLCNTGDPLTACTISIVTAFGTAVVSCSTRTASLTSVCGTRPSGFFGSTQNVALVDLSPSICQAYADTTGSRGCDASQDGAAVQKWRAHLYVRVRREDGADGGTMEEIGTYYLLTAIGSTISASTSWTGQLRLPIGQGCGCDLTYSLKRCLPCGFYAVRNNSCGCGLEYKIASATTCCNSSLSHTVTIACAP